MLRTRYANDQINQEELLTKLHTFPTLRRQIKAWLKSGVLDKGQWFSTHLGTPQGGVVSPLLANIALHGLEERIKQAFPRQSANETRATGNRQPPHLIRYADDFVVLHEDLTVVQHAQQIISAQSIIVGVAIFILVIPSLLRWLV